LSYNPTSVHVTATTFDDRLKRAVDTLSDRLRDEIARELRMGMEELSTEESTVIASPAPLQESASTRILDAVRALDAAGSLSAVLDPLVARALAESPGTRLFLVRADGLRAWRDDECRDERVADTAIGAEAVRAKCAVTRVGSTTDVAELHAFPLALSGDVVAILCVEGPVATLEVIARHAARVLESLTAFKTARALVSPLPIAAPQSTDAPAAGNEEIAARRYARLLISEIKLYHRDAVEEGQRERDLAIILGGEIARARSLYGERVPADVPHAAEFFRDELVPTLAGGDASLLVDVSAA
jgi:hypothetical protein